MTSAPDAADELFHPVGDHPAWSESYYFNFVDPDTGLGAFTRMGFRPNDGWADALHGVYLPGGRVAFTYGRVAFTYGRRTDLSAEVIASMADADPAVAHLRLHRGEAFRRWDVVYDGPAQVMDDPHVMLLPTKARPAGWASDEQLSMDVAFEALSGPHYAVGGSQGHFEQTCRATGTVRLGEVEWRVTGYGVRDKSWGPRTWQAPSGSAAKRAEGSVAASGCFINWFSMNFGPDLALGGTCGRTADGTFRGRGWIHRDGETLALEDAQMSTEFDPEDPLLHRTVQLRGTDERGRSIVVDGTVLTICPTKIPRRDGVTFVNEGLARFEAEGRTGFGIAEHWHAVPR